MPAGRSSARPGHHQAGAGVEAHDVAVGPVLPGQHPAGEVGVDGGVAAHQVLTVDPAQAERLGIDLPRGDLAVAELDHRGRARGGELVEPVAAVDDQRPLGPLGREHAGHALGHAEVGHADQVPLAPGRGWRAARGC